jgi:hypothetical protein
MIGLPKLDDKDAKASDGKPFAGRVDQRELDGTEETDPPMRELRGRFEAHIGKHADSCGIEVFAAWLQAPHKAPHNPKALADSICEERAKDLAPLLSRPGTSHHHSGDGLVWRFGRSSQKGQENWKALDDAIAKGGAATLYGPAEQVGGVNSWFTTGKHVVVCLAIGREKVEEKIREFHIVFDPDVRATAATCALWGDLIAKHVPPDASLSDVEPKTRYLILHTMIFGQGNGRFGPVVRKYYPDKQRLLGKIGRNM